jgi:hypothetical protein
LYEEALAAYDHALEIDPHYELARGNRTLALDRIPQKSEERTAPLSLRESVQPRERTTEFIQPILRRKSTWEKITRWFFERFS